VSGAVDKDTNREVPIVVQDHTDDYFAELCALASTGTLSPAEWRQLEAHLSHCPSCRVLKAEYERVVSTTLPAMAANKDNANDGDSPDAWSLEEAERALFERIDRGNIEPEKVAQSPESSSRFRLSLAGAVAAALLVSCSYAAYRVGEAKGHGSQAAFNSAGIATPVVQVEPPKASPPLRRQSERADREMAARLTELQHRLQASMNETTELETQRQSLLDQLSQRDYELKNNEGQRADLEQRLSVAQSDAQILRAKFDAATTQSPAKPSLEALQQRVNDLTTELDQRDQQISKEEELLEHDHDIRNLMGARDLYIGEIYDVAKSGKTQKPFGRVFYTQGKSLVFYAYDLDQQPGVKLASTFQAWGRRGVDQQHDISLGIFYQDDQNKKRWVLKSNDSATLSKLDAVFVTVEPHGESARPTGKPLLFTYLKLPPNHP
jgi:hypothetical protein